MITKTYIAKAIEATKGKTIKQLRGFFDQASKNVVADRQILARIVKGCVEEARPFSVAEIERFLPKDIYIATTPVLREDAAAEDPGPVRQENTEDGTTDEGVVRFDILFTLKLPGTKEPILLIINVEIQNTDATPYSLDSRGVDYACRLVSRQGSDYGNLKKAYSIWIVTNTKDAKTENTTKRLGVAEFLNGGGFAEASKSAQRFEAWFLYLGESEKAVDSELLRMLDILFSTSIDVQDKKKMIETQYGVRMSKEVTKNMGVMLDMELAIEAKARQEGEARGEARGETNGLLKAYLDTKQTRAFILRKLEKHLGNPEKARVSFDEYTAEHPEEAAYLEGPEDDILGK